MDALRHGAAVLALLVASPALAAPPVPDAVAQWQPQIAEASAWFGVPRPWIERVMRAESGGHTTLGGYPITSRAGAMGLMQLMPATWAAMRAALGLGPDPHDPRANILAGTAYLRMMYDRFGYPGLFAAYNAGPARYAAARASGRSLPAETRAFWRALLARAHHRCRPRRGSCHPRCSRSKARIRQRRRPSRRLTAWHGTRSLRCVSGHDCGRCWV